MRRNLSRIGIIAVVPSEPSGVTPLPGPPADQNPPSVSYKGPSDIFGALVAGEPGLAMVTPRGGAMSSPKQQADREIKLLIKHLN